MNSAALRARGLTTCGAALLAGFVLQCSPAAPTGSDGATSTDAQRSDAPASEVGRADAAGSDAARTDVNVVDTGTPAPDVVAPPDAPPSSDPYDSARDACVAEINRYRAMRGLAPYARWREAESCADQMAVHDAMVNVAHDGFQHSICAPRGGGENECPHYGGPEALNGCLAQMWAEGPTADGMWDTAHGHYLNMIGDYTYMGYHQHFTMVACGYSAGGWMLQNFQ